MDLSSCLLQFRPFTNAYSLKLPPVSISSKSFKPICSIPPHLHRKVLALISDSSSPSLTNLYSPSASHELPPEFTTEQLLRSLSQQNDEASALKLFYRASKQPNFEPTLPVYEEIIRKLGQVGSLDSMKQILEDMRVSSCRPTKGTFKILVENYAKRGLFDDAIGVLDTIEQAFELRLGVYAYNFLLNVLVDGNKFKLVESVRSMMLSKGVVPNVYTFNILIKGLCKCHQTSHAILMMEDMSKYGLAPDTITYTTIMKGCIEEGDLGTAIGIKDAMIAAECPLSQVTVHVLIDGYCKQGRVEEALNLLKDMELSGCVQGVVAYTTLIAGFIKTKKIEQAEEIFYQMNLQGVPRNKITYNTLIDGLCMSNRMEKAEELMDQMIMEGLRPDVLTYGSLIKGWCIVGKPEKASWLLKTIKTKGMALTPKIYNALIHAFFQGKRTKEAMRVLEEIEEKGTPPDGISYGAAFQGLCSGGGTTGEAVDLLVDFLIQMIEKRMMPDPSCFYMLADGLCALSMVDTLVMLSERIMKMDDFSENEVSTVRDLMKMRKFQGAFVAIGRILRSRNPKGR